MAKIVWARAAREQFLALEHRLASAVRDALTLLEADPDAGLRLRGRLQGLRSLRIGAFRIVYEVRQGGKAVRILSVRHRSVAYRRASAYGPENGKSVGRK